MRLRFALLPMVVVLGASVALADYGSPPPPPPQQQPAAQSQAEETPRERAERSFAQAYDDVVGAGKDMDKGKKDNANKKYRRARDRARTAVELDSTYHEAWNLVGFTSRKLGDYPASFAAYQTALRLDPNFALAREYYGEGLLETGDLAGARLQLKELQRIGAKTEIAQLDGAITAYVEKHPDAAPATATAAAGAPADTSHAPAPAKADSTKMQVAPGGR